MHFYIMRWGKKKGSSLFLVNQWKPEHSITSEKRNGLRFQTGEFHHGATVSLIKQYLLIFEE
jgi:hypothetical protein